MTFGRLSPRSLSISNRLLLSLALLFVTSEVFAGVVRYYSASAGVPWVAYVPKGLLVVAALVALCRVTWTGRAGAVFAGALALFATYVPIGALFTGRWTQAAFGAFSWFPFVFGALCESTLVGSWKRVVPYIALLWTCAAAGVVLDALTEVPWIGARYELGGVEITVSRQWWATAFERVAGFSRGSVEAAAQLLFFAIPLVVLTRATGTRWLLWAATGVLVALTTTKKAVGVYLLLTMLMPVMASNGLHGQFRVRVQRTLPIAAALIGAGLPVSTLFVHYHLQFDSPITYLIFKSFAERLTITWPEGFRLASEHGSVLLGRGIGGIGAAQNYFEPSMYTYGDNLYLYLYASLGALGIILALLYAMGISRVGRYHDPWSKVMWAVGLMLLLSGWAGNVVESGISSFLLGVTSAYAWRAAQLGWRETRRLGRTTTVPQVVGRILGGAEPAQPAGVCR